MGRRPKITKKTKDRANPIPKPEKLDPNIFTIEFPQVGIRKFSNIDYDHTCTISGVSSTEPLHIFYNSNTAIVRGDFHGYVDEFIHYKFRDSSTNHALSLTWESVNSGTSNFVGVPIFSSSINSDMTVTISVLKKLKDSYEKSNTQEENNN